MAVDEGSAPLVRVARAEDVQELAEMVQDFVVGHPAEAHPRRLDALREAYFGARPVAEVVVAQWRARVVGMGQWTRIYDMFWGVYGGQAEWLYLRPEVRGIGLSAAIIAKICERIRLAGGEFLQGPANEHTESLYARSAAPGGTTRTYHLSAEAFACVADLSGRPPREIVRALPDPALNRVPARQRAQRC